MPLFEIKHNKLNQIKEEPFKLEKQIQDLTEKNMNTIFSLNFVKTEFTLGGFRIDTLAFDEDSKSFVIIEYKKNKNFSVVDQGYAYLSLMLNNKSDFILEYNENQDKTLKREDVDWSQSKVVFISPSFTTFQKESINFKDLPIELWEIKKFQNSTVGYTQIKTSGSQESIKTISKKDSTVKKVTKEIKVYTEDEHLKTGSEETLELYERYKNEILNYDNVDFKPKKKYLAFIGSRNIADIRIQKNAIKLWLNLNKGDLDDPKEIARDVSNIGHWGNGDYELKIADDENVEYILSLIRQSYNKNKK